MLLGGWRVVEQREGVEEGEEILEEVVQPACGGARYE